MKLSCLSGRSVRICYKAANFSPKHSYVSTNPRALKTTLLNSSIALQRNFVTSIPYKMPVDKYKAEEKGEANTESYQVFIKDDDGPISPFHDIPLVANGDSNTFHVVIEVPRWTNAKMEIDTKSPLHPIIQDKKKGKLRYVANSFPHHGYIWNYGYFPQTWENPNHKDESTGAMGDNDPVDICEIGHRVAKRGDVLEVKVLGTLAMIDDGETDWKMIVIDVDDPIASELNNLDDVENAMPGFLSNTREWFRVYKMPDGKPENKFGFDGEYQNAEFACKIIEETNVFWKQLVGLEEPSEDPGKLEVGNVLCDGSKKQLSRDEASGIFSSAPDFGQGPELESSVDTWHYCHLKQ